MTLHRSYSDEQWSHIADVIKNAGFVLSEEDARSVRGAMDSAAHYFSWPRPGTDKKRADRIMARLGTVRRRTGQLRKTNLGSKHAMKLATEIEQDLNWLEEVDATFVRRINRLVKASNVAGWLLVLDIELRELEQAFPSWVEHRQRYESPSPLHKWLRTLCEVWERSGLDVRSSGHFPAFVMAAKTRGIRSEQLTETTVRDFVLRQWRCRTAES